MEGSVDSASLPPDGKHQSSNEKREQPLTVMAFFVFGSVIYTTYSLIIACAQDILAGTYIQTSLVLVANIAPYFLVTLVAPYFMQKIPYLVRIATVSFSQASGIFMVAFAGKVHWKLTGVGIVSFGFGVGETTFLALTSFYHEVALNAYSAGTGISLVIAPLYYTAMTTWACVSPDTTIMISGFLFFLLFVCYYVMDKKHLKSASSPTNKHAGVSYTALDTNDDETGKLASEGTSQKEEPLSYSEKFMVIRQMLPSVIPLYIAFLSEYLIIQSVITTLAFPNAPFRPRDHYQYYTFIFFAGEVAGRSYLVVLSCIKAEWAASAKLPYLCGMSAIEVAHLLFFVLAAWFRFSPNVWIVMLLSFTAGVTIGVLYVNALVFFRESFEERYKEFAMGYGVVAMGGGTLTAALLGLYIEPLLRQHCMALLTNDDYCFTRSKTVENITALCQRGG